MYQSLNEIVDQQGITLHKIEDTTAETLNEVKTAHTELKKALKYEKTLKQRILDGDLSTRCLVLVFVFVVIMCFVDFIVNGA